MLTELRSIYEKFSNVYVSHEHKRIVETLSKNDSIVIMKQDKGRGVVIMDKHKYTEKCLEMLNTKQFSKISVNPTKKTEAKIQRVLRKIESKLTIQEYHRLYSTGSCPGKFYGAAKIHKSKLNDKLYQLPIRPIVSNIGTATYNLARYLTKLLSPLSKSKYTIDSTKHFIEKIKQETIPGGYKMVSFDVKSLFPNVPLKKTIDITLERIYDRKEINTQIIRPEMKELLTLCTKNVQFTFDNQVYQQNDGVAMGSPLGPVLAGIFMVELEKQIIPTLGNMVLNKKRFVEDTIGYFKNGRIDIILSKLNSFHPNIQFTYEIQKENKLPFLVVLLIRNY